MKKAVFVMDMPDNCRVCDLLIKDEYICPVCMSDGLYYEASVYEDVENETKPDWCPLKEIPEKIDIPEFDDNIKAENKNAEEVGLYMYDRGIYRGYNLCIGKILGE